MPGSKQGVEDYRAAKGVDALDTLLDDEERTRPVKASQELHRLNEEVAIIWGGGPVGSIVRFEDGKVITPAQFTRSLYRDRVYVEFRVDKEGNTAPGRLHYAAEDWLAWPARARVRNVTYLPGQPSITDEGDFNLWLGGGVEPRKGQTKPFDDLLKRMFKGIDPAHLLWLKRWLAYPIRNPGTKMFTCVLLWSHTGGTGKNLLGEIAAPIYGASNVTTIKSRHLAGDFNGWAEGKQFIIGDEITLEDKRHTSGDLKSMLTSRTVRINRKGIESYEIPDCANFLFTSNDPTAIMLDQGERRTFVWHVNEEPLGDDYGRDFMRWLYGYQGPPYDRPAEARSGAAALAWYLTEELEMGDFSPTAPPPDTAAKLELISNSRSEIDSWAVALALEPDRWLAPQSGQKFAPSQSSSGRGPYSIYTPEDLLRLYDPEGRQRTSLRALGIALDRAGFRKALHNNGRVGNTRSTFWLIRDDDKSRAPITSTEAARRYAAERPEPFVQPSQREEAERRKPQ